MAAKHSVFEWSCGSVHGAAHIRAARNQQLRNFAVAEPRRVTCVYVGARVEQALYVLNLAEANRPKESIRGRGGLRRTNRRRRYSWGWILRSQRPGQQSGAHQKRTGPPKHAHRVA